MPYFPDLPFVSLLQYSPRGVSAVSRLSKEVCYGLKKDGTIVWLNSQGQRESVSAIRYALDRLRVSLSQHPFLADCFGPDTTLIPIPRSSPLSDVAALWPSRRICQALVEAGLAKDFLPLLVRTEAIQKSAFSKPGTRPSPETHYQTTKVETGIPLLVGRKFTLVDDVITRGATFLGMVPRVREAFPGAKISCFAVIRTMSGVEVERIPSPVAGNITMSFGQPKRHP